MTEAVGHGGPCSAAGAADEQLAILERLRVCLDTLSSAHDLRRRDVRAAEQAIRRLDRHAMAPTANEFWATTALPRAQRLLVETRHVIDRDLLCLQAHADRPGSRLRVSHREVVSALPSTQHINDLGCWWQQRLRRAALIRSAAAVVGRPPSQAELTIANHEMALLNRAPWAHGDRLLSAFELVHGEIVRFGRRRVDQLFRQVRSDRGVGPGERLSARH
ncbi:MAG: hypothetical protein OEV40_07295 [Acidimicrobiia bacterium]|nr:hypothetical protein [Acidimicrobiia bacterium]